MKIISSTVLFLLLTINLFPQSFYIKATGGYGIKTSIDYFTSKEDINTTARKITTEESVPYSFGEGLNLNISTGYKITPNFGAELELGYLKSSPVDVYSNRISDNESELCNLEYKAHSYSITPSVFVTTDFCGIKPFAKFGVIFAFPKVNLDWSGPYSNTVDPIQGNVQVEEEYTGNIAVGISSSFGITYNIYDRYSLVFEVNSRNLSYSPKEFKMKDVKFNNVSQFSESDKNNMVWKFADKKSYGIDSDGDANKVLNMSYAFSSLSFSLGVMVEL